jgi:hypothetical protein
MALTAHKTVTMFMRYVHAEDDPIRAAAEVVSAHRRGVVSGTAASLPAANAVAPADPSSEPAAPMSVDAPDNVEGRLGHARTELRKYPPFRKCGGPNRSAPPNTTPAADEADHV